MSEQSADSNAPAEAAKGKRLYKCGVSYDLAAGSFEAYSYEPDGATKHGSVIGSLSDFSPEIQRQLALHGLTQRITDDTRKGETPADRLRMIQERVAALRDGKWAERVTDGMVERLCNVLQEFARREDRAIDIATYRDKLQKSPALRARMLAEKPKLYAIYQELYGAPESDDLDELD